MKLAEGLFRKFTERGWKYKIGGNLETPTVSDLEKVLSDMFKMLEDEPEETQVVLGRMIMRKTSSSYDVYVFEGEYDG